MRNKLFRFRSRLWLVDVLSSPRVLTNTAKQACVRVWLLTPCDTDKNTDTAACMKEQVSDLTICCDTMLTHTILNINFIFPPSLFLSPLPSSSPPCCLEQQITWASSLWVRKLFLSCICMSHDCKHHRTSQWINFALCLLTYSACIVHDTQQMAHTNVPNHKWHHYINCHENNKAVVKTNSDCTFTYLYPSTSPCAHAAQRFFEILATVFISLYCSAHLYLLSAPSLSLCFLSLLCSPSLSFSHNCL